MAITTAGNSGTPLWRKLGPAPRRRRFLRMAPPAFDERLAGAPAGITRLARLADFDFRSVSPRRGPSSIDRCSFCSRIFVRTV